MFWTRNVSLSLNFEYYKLNLKYSSSDFLQVKNKSLIIHSGRNKGCFYFNKKNSWQILCFAPSEHTTVERFQWNISNLWLIHFQFGTKYVSPLHINDTPYIIFNNANTHSIIKKSVKIDKQLWKILKKLK